MKQWSYLFWGMKWKEFAVLAILIGILLFMVVTAVQHAYPEEAISQALSSMKQLQTAAQQMTLENEMKGSLVAWTCSNNIPLTVEQWTNGLVEGGYLRKEEINTALTEGGPQYGLTVFAVTAGDPTSTVFLATKNWHGPEGGAANGKITGRSYGSRNFAIMHKSGEGVFLERKRASDPFWIGEGGQHDLLPLK